jgi:hypothetical protein
VSELRWVLLAWPRVLATRVRLRRWRGAPMLALMRPAAGERCALPVAQAEAMARAVARAARAVPGARCLARAIALVRWLRARGAPARLALGVRRTSGGVQAHAWVEFDGRALGEDASGLAGFQPLAEPPAQATWSR